MLLFLMTQLDGWGHKARFLWLYARYKDRLYRVALRLLGDPEEAQDAVQASLVKIILNFEKISPLSQRKMESYIVTIVENTAKDMLRKASRRHEVPLDDTWEPPAPGGPESETGYRRLVELIAAMPEQYREVLLLSFVEEETASNIAKRLDLTEDQVSGRIARGRKLLIQRLKEEGYEP